MTVPKIERRYYTVQFLNGWGETLANINERLFPDKPSGQFAVCYKGCNVPIPVGAARINLPARFSRVLLRVELGENWDDAVALQHQFKPSSYRYTRKLPDIPKTVMFDMENCRALSF